MKHKLRYIFTWVSLAVLLITSVHLVAIAWNSKLASSFSSSMVVLIWILNSASGIYLFMLAVKKAHRQWLTEDRIRKEEAEAEAERLKAKAARRDPSRENPALDFASVARKLVRRIPENSKLEKLGDSLLKNLSRELEIMSGIWYVEKKGSFKAAATYALVPSEKPYTFQTGEGLTGQVARDQQLMVLTRLPEGIKEVYSGLGKAPPSYLAIMPLVHKKKTVAVLECSGYKYDPHDVENMFRIFSRDLMEKLAGGKK